LGVRATRGSEGREGLASGTLLILLEEGLVLLNAGCFLLRETISEGDLEP
jgi:hypothetical protein